MSSVTATVTGTVFVRNPAVGPLAILAIIVVAIAGVFIYSVIRKGL